MKNIKFIILIFTVFWIPLCAFADHKTDSLINIVHQYEKKTRFESDTNYIKTLIHIAEIFQITQQDSSLLFSNKAYQLSTQHGYSQGILSSAFVMASVYSKQWDTHNLMQIGNEILPLAEKTSRKSLSRVYNILGTAYYQISDDRTNIYRAKELYLKSLNISEEYNDTTSMIRTLSNLATVCNLLNDYSSSVEYFYRAINLAEKVEDIANMPNLFFGLSNIYYHQKKFDQALIELKKAIEHAEKHNDIINVGHSQLSLCLIYNEQNKLDEALECANNAIQIFQHFNLTTLQTNAKRILCITLAAKGLYSEALKLAYEVLEEMAEISRFGEIKNFKMVISEIYFDMKQYQSAIRICNEVLEEGADNIYTLTHLHAMMSRIYEAQNNGMKALEHYKQHKIYSDSLFHNDLDEKMINLEAQNKYEKKEMELKAEQALKDAGYEKDKAHLQLFIIFVCVLFLSMLVFLIIILRSRKKLRAAYIELEYAHVEIQQQKEEISAQSEELKATNGHLVGLIKFKQDISGMIVHDLKNPLSIMLALTKAIPDEWCLALLHDSAQRMLNLVLNILDINKYEDSKLELKYADSDINNLIESVTNDSNAALNFKKLNINLRLQDDLVFPFDRDIIRRVLDNILNNAIKFSPENETIHISTVKDDENVRITIRNSGSSIPADMQKAIFEPYVKADREENDSSLKSTGLGLAFCKMAVTAHSGTIGVESSPEKPTDFWFSLPYNLKS